MNKAPLDQVEVMFETAMRACAEGRCVYFEALANERLARLFLDEMPDEENARKYLKQGSQPLQKLGSPGKGRMSREKKNNIQMLVLRSQARDDIAIVKSTFALELQHITVMCVTVRNLNCADSHRASLLSTHRSWV